MREQQAEAQRAILRMMCDATGWTPTRLANEAGIAQSTLNRRMKPGDQGLISVDIWRRLSEASGVTVPAEILNAAPVSATEIDQRILERVLLLCLTEMRLRKPADLARSLAPQIAYGYQTFLEYEAAGNPITDDRAALRVVRNMLARLRGEGN